jgi:uncharacterized protein
MTEDLRKVQFVIKTSKLCNLRCRYCYEFAELHEKERMTLEQLDQLYTHIVSYYRQLEYPAHIELVWHGGEPLLTEPEFYWQTLARQKQIFGELAAHVTNQVQTNLTVLNQERLELLKTGFDGVGVSLDLFGGLRVNQSGHDSLPRVLKHLDQLRDWQIPYGCITVLTKNNLPYIREIFQFYEGLQVSSFRLLPLNNGAYVDQHAAYDISTDQVITAFKTLFELLLQGERAFQVDPISRFLNQVLHYYLGDKDRGTTSAQFYNRREWESIFVVNVNGDLFSYGDAYQPDLCQGNLFKTPLAEIMQGLNRERSIRATEKRIASVCQTCRFYGSCDGYAVAEESQIHNLVDAEGRAECIVEKAMLRYIETRLMEIGVINPVTAKFNFPKAVNVAQHFPVLPLQQDIQLVLQTPDPVDAPNRWSLSTGVTNQITSPPNGLQYSPHAWIPQATWRTPTPTEQTLLAPHSLETWQSGSTIGIIRLPDHLLTPLTTLLDRQGSRDALPKQWQHSENPGWQLAIRDLLVYLQHHYSLDGLIPTNTCLVTANPGLQTVTQDPDPNNPTVQQYVGLHVDSWEKALVVNRHLSRNRICLNLGKEDRYFLFINLTLIKMAQLLALSTAEIEQHPGGTSLAEKFMQTFPSYPVIKLRLHPGEAYIASTDNMIHDATTLTKQYPDIAIHFLGNFGMVGISGPQAHPLDELPDVLQHPQLQAG